MGEQTQRVEEISVIKLEAKTMIEEHQATAVAAHATIQRLQETASLCLPRFPCVGVEHTNKTPYDSNSCSERGIKMVLAPSENTPRIQHKRGMAS